MGIITSCALKKGVFPMLQRNLGRCVKEEMEDITHWTDYVNRIDYEGHLVNLLENGEEKRKKNGERDMDTVWNICTAG